MADPQTVALQRLLGAIDPSAREAAWAEFVRASSKLILHAARTVCRDHDAAMDQYAYVLEQLRQDDCRRLRLFVSDGRSDFSTWLVVVTQRICVDRHRQRYGRVRPRAEGGTPPNDDLAVRRRLVNLIGADVDLASLPDHHAADADRSIRVDEVHHALESALARLKPQDRVLIKLRFEDGCSVADVAEVLRLPSRFHAHRRLMRVLAELRRALEDRQIWESEP